MRLLTALVLSVALVVVLAMQLVLVASTDFPGWVLAASALLGLGVLLFLAFGPQESRT